MRLLLLLALAGCDDHLVGMNASHSCDREPPLTYESFGEGFMNKHCIGCHTAYLDNPRLRENAPTHVNLDTWADTVHWAERIWERALVRGDMPPGGGPDQVERALLQEWLACEVGPAAGAFLEAP